MIGIEAVQSASSDDALMTLLSQELSERAKGTSTEIDDVVKWLATLPRGLRAMAATHQLDISMAFDDLGWHSANWHNRRYCDETQEGLRELEATEAADIFAEAYRHALQYWSVIGDLITRDSKEFIRWYDKSPLKAELEPLNDRMQALCGRSSKYGLMSYWLEYARKHPENFFDRSAGLKPRAG